MFTFSTQDGINDDFEKSHDLFRDAFLDGFPWEVLWVVHLTWCSRGDTGPSSQVSTMDDKAPGNW